MADSVGVSAVTGRVLTDWQHVEQSIRKILTTPIGSRVMRRDFGSRIFDFIDAKMTAANILGIYAAAAEAIEAWEPRFRAYRAAVSSASADGAIELTLFGFYFPRGHLGDYSMIEDANFRLTLSA